MTENWSLKYRPRSLKDCVLDHLDDDLRQILLAVERGSELPNLLFYGPPGTGKTSIARILCNDQRYVVDMLNGSVIEKRGVVDIERLMCENLFGKPRCILIDEVDGMTTKAQMALRSLIDAESIPVHWLFTANESDGINAALWSRVTAVNCSYSQPKRREAHFSGIVNRCKHILRSEQIRRVRDAAIREIVELNYPDVRQTILSLQRKFGYIDRAA